MTTIGSEDELATPSRGVEDATGRLAKALALAETNGAGAAELEALRGLLVRATGAAQSVATAGPSGPSASAR